MHLPDIHTLLSLLFFLSLSVPSSARLTPARYPFFCGPALFVTAAEAGVAVTTLARYDSPQPQHSQQLPLPVWAGTWPLSPRT